MVEVYYHQDAIKESKAIDDARRKSLVKLVGSDDLLANDQSPSIRPPDRRTPDEMRAYLRAHNPKT